MDIEALLKRADDYHRLPSEDKQLWGSALISDLAAALHKMQKKLDEARMLTTGPTIEERDQLRAENEKLVKKAADLQFIYDMTLSERYAGEAENARLKGQLKAIEEDGTEEHNAAVRLRQELAQVREERDSARGACLEWDQLHKKAKAECDQLRVGHETMAERLIVLEEGNARLKKYYDETKDGVLQTLGKALGYPWFKDDQQNFPGATEEHGVCVGDYVAETIAMEAAHTLKELQEENARLKEERVNA